jgi:hypothetical protein
MQPCSLAMSSPCLHVNLTSYLGSFFFNARLADMEEIDDPFSRIFYLKHLNSMSLKQNLIVFVKAEICPSLLWMLSFSEISQILDFFQDLMKILS